MISGARAQRQGFRRYREGLLRPGERNKTLTSLANTKPLVGAQHKEAQSLQWFLSEEVLSNVVDQALYTPENLAGQYSQRQDSPLNYLCPLMR